MALIEPARKLYAYTDLSLGKALWLELDGRYYELVSFTGSFACNEIPTAQCMLAVGRVARTGLPASAHVLGLSLEQMTPARVHFKPEGEYSPTGKSWSGDDLIIFDGYYVGFSYRKIDGKTMIMVSLMHWLIDLAMSSTLSAASHPSNPWRMTSQAVMAKFAAPTKAGEAQPSGQPANLSSLV